MGNSFDFFVLSVLDNLQVFSGMINTLVVTTVDQHVRTEKCMEKGTGQIIGRMQSVFFRLLVQVLIGHFTDCAVEVEVYKLHAFADAENRFLLPDKQVEGAELFQVESQIDRRSGSANRFFVVKIR